MWKRLRIAILLIVLAAVALDAWLADRRVHRWSEPVVVAVYPLAADDSPGTARYVAALTARDFAPITAFFDDEAQRYGLALRHPLRVVLPPPPRELPPQAPTEKSQVAIIWWSLRLRWYAWRQDRVPDAGASPIRLYVLFHDPSRSPVVPHSAGLEKGLIGIAHVFATAHMSGSNLVVIAHELLHTLGATDKYDPWSDRPLYPDGYGDPAQTPRYPQRFAELMAGRRALSPTAQEMPVSLAECLIGPATAHEIRWSAR